MASKFAHSLTVLVLIASMFGVSAANKDWFSGFNYTDWWSRYQKPNKTQPQSNTIAVGGSENWHFGFNYSDWAFKNGPFYLNDALVFKYDAPNATTHPHSVYMFSNFWSFLKCDLKRAKMLANVTQGVGEGFKVVLKRWQPYYFACGERNGFHCTNGGMSFAVMPMPRSFFPLP
ncbi:uncharacterized protein LOC129293874 [Prosopis cineraria]|uniref:uncharacterized protein LOC129293874 n=1 Tax=Prosopis cineraria TaxID=364024 RepID=UPI00240F13EF|nr:uncharacterized protein LOC129293874 [Prosopis cineraria]